MDWWISGSVGLERDPGVIGALAVRASGLALRGAKVIWHSWKTVPGLVGITVELSEKVIDLTLGIGWAMQVAVVNAHLRSGGRTEWLIQTRPVSADKTSAFDLPSHDPTRERMPPIA